MTKDALPIRRHYVNWSHVLRDAGAAGLAITLAATMGVLSAQHQPAPEVLTFGLGAAISYFFSNRRLLD